MSNMVHSPWLAGMRPSKFSRSKPEEVPVLRDGLLAGVHERVDQLAAAQQYGDAAYLRYFADQLASFSLGWIGREIGDEAMIAVEDFNMDGVVKPTARWNLAEAMPALSGFVVLEVPTLHGYFATPLKDEERIKVAVSAISWYVEGDEEILFQLYTNSDSADIDSLVDADRFRLVSEFSLPFLKPVTREGLATWLGNFGVPAFKIPHHQSLIMFIGNLFIIANSSKVAESSTDSFPTPGEHPSSRSSQVKIIVMRPLSRPGAPSPSDRGGERKRGKEHRWRVRAHLRWITTSQIVSDSRMTVTRRPTYVRGHLRGAEGTPIIARDRVMKWIWN